MANVFTKKFHRPRTTTLKDFGPKPDPPVPRRPRILSPTWRCNPHPTGLESQSAYNRNGTTFDIWNPDFAKMRKRYPCMMAHLRFKNFCSGQAVIPNKEKGSGQAVIPNKEKDIQYSLTTTMRINFQKPAHFPDVPHEQRATRFGYTTYKPARGIVPNTLPPFDPDSSEKGNKN